MPLGDKIKELRMKSGESLQDVASAIGASKAHVWEMESGRSKIRRLICSRSSPHILKRLLPI